MDAEQRREEIIGLLNNSNLPISGTDIARQLGVSRQIIVQDIALLRAVNKNILSTNKGYVLFQEIEKIGKIRKTFKVQHLDEKIQDELYTIVDLGGRVLDVVVEHDIYGQISVDLIINSRADVDNFIEKVRTYKTKSLNELTDGVHFHTIEADSEVIMTAVEKALYLKGYLQK